MSFKSLLLLLFIIPVSISYSQYDPDYNSEDEDDLSELDFKDRLYTGGNVWAQLGSITSVEIAPILGYRISKEYSIGVGKDILKKERLLQWLPVLHRSYYLNLFFQIWKE